MSMDLSTIQSFTIPKHELVVPATSESSWGNYNGTDWDNWGDTLILNAGDTCIITVDGVKYTCTAYEYMGDYGVCLGDGRLQDKADHPEDVPFFVAYFCDRVNGRYIHDIGFFYPDSETHTIEIQRVVPSVVTEIKDSLGRVIWSAVKEVGALIFRPSADISVGHALTPANSTSAYLLINEEVSDGSSTYIAAAEIGVESVLVSESKFALSSTSQIGNRRLTITSVLIEGANAICDFEATTTYNEFILEINGVRTATYQDRTGSKNTISIAIPDAIPLINDVLATTGTLPNMNIIIRSTGSSYSSNMGSKGSNEYADVTHIYVTLGYEA